MNPRPLQDKSYRFALRIIDVCRKLQQQREYVLAKQLLKSGTSIGANVQEAQLAQSRKDFISKLHISAKEAYETRYWLRLLRDSKVLEIQEAERLLLDLEEIIRLLVAIIKTSKQK
ncbi:four helix bundle protein [Candidatus Peribacteria bacterium]|nr:four helix bundle protein [Candidatus Peribacteria bacterium]